MYFKVGVTVFFLYVEVTVLIFPREGVGFAYMILVAGERLNVTGEYFERGSTSE